MSSSLSIMKVSNKQPILKMFRKLNQQENAFFHVHSALTKKKV